MKRLTFLKKSSLTSLFGLFLYLLFHLVYALPPPPLPSEENPLLIYSNQEGHDLRQIFRKSIQRAERSIDLIIYHLSDPHLIDAINKKAEEGLEISIYTEASEARNIKRKLSPAVHLTARHAKKLMHQKILIVDDHEIWIGSANMTPESLKVHGNLVLGMENPLLVQSLKERLFTGKGYDSREFPLTFLIQEQKLALWILPSTEETTLQQLIDLIEQAKQSIRVAMFTFTHSKLVAALVAAKARGVDVQVVVDGSSSRGASAKACEKLALEGVDLKFSNGIGLLHHKMMVIDEEILVTGSTNWTLSAFQDNDDIFLALSPLTSKQRQQLRSLWKVISHEAD